MEKSTAPSSRSKRKSIAHQPSSAGEKDNVTTDVAALQRAGNPQNTKKKSRGKSIGPGGLEALRETSGNATKAETTVQIRSILKPTVPLTPPKVIPSFDELRQRSTRKRSPAKSGAEELLIDFSTPAPVRDAGPETAMTGVEKVMDPFSPVKHAESNSHPSEQDEMEAEARRQAAKQAALDRRAERRKSMANRRVSFAPEATLHTWSVMELGEDSTTSSASNSTRRQSSMTSQSTPKTQTSFTAQSPASERPTTPPEQAEETQVAASPAHQRDLHQRKRRRSSTAPSAQLEGSFDEVLSSSPSGDVLTESSPVRIDDSVGSDTDDDTDGDTAMSMDEPTSQSLMSEDSTGSQTSLDDRLRQAASLAGTRGIEYDENGDDLSMEMATSTVTNALQPWANGGRAAETSTMTGQENMMPFSPASKARSLQLAEGSPQEDDEQEDTQDMSMDVTNAIGGILQNAPPGQKRRKSIANRRRSSMPRRQSTGTDSDNDDDSMDFTAVGGQILSKQQDEYPEEMSDEDMTMEFTNVVGGVLGRQNAVDSMHPLPDDETIDLTSNMDVTRAYGGILPPIEEQTEPQTDVEDNQTAAMDMTTALGRVIPGIASQDDETTQMDMTRAVGGILASNGNRDENSKRPSTNQNTPEDSMQIGTRASTPKQHTVKGRGLVNSVASETGSPDITLKPRLSGRSRQSQGPSTTPKFSPRRPSPAKSSPMKARNSTPTKQMTPLPSKVETPNKTPVNVDVTHRTASPKRLFKDEIKARQSPGSVKKDNSATVGIFAQDGETGSQTPSIVLRADRPQLGRRRSSGVGIDQEGFGSPRVAEMLNKRSSIVETAPEFKLDVKQRSRLRFEDPQEMAREVDAERAEEERRESGRFVMEQEAEGFQGENTTTNLRQMIESMTPKKEPKSRLKGRKSLAVGAARGLLGKRPAELDLDEEASPSSPKRLKAVEREGSPVKKVHLPKPPSKEEITGRLTRAEQKRLQELTTAGSTTPAASPPKKSATSPHPSGRYKDVPLEQATDRPESFVDKLDNVMDAVDMSTEHNNEPEKDSISLQEFLNMTNIHFIELSTTKRRHTQAPVPQRPSQEQADRSTEAQFVAAGTTLPLIELYQHATRELKRNISDGRKVIRSIETEILHEQPALFKEYVDARPDVRTVMDNQFRNGKTNARLQSKEIWYTWRGQLVDGLRSGLEGIKRDMQRDVEQLEVQQAELDAIVPALQQEQESLTEELSSLQLLHADLDSVDLDALFQARADLKTADNELARKSALLDTLKQQMAEKEDALKSAEEFKIEMKAQIDEADRVRQEFRGWPVADVLALKSKVDDIEKQTGWKLITAEDDPDDPNDFGVALTMMFSNDLRLFFYPGAFQTSSNSGRRRSGRKSKSVSGPTAPISLTFTPVDHDGEPIPGKEPSTENRFFLQLIRSQLHAFSMMPKRSVSPKTLLDTVSQGWRLAKQVSEEIRLLNMTGITSVQILGDEKLGVRTRLVLPERSRIDVEFALSITTLIDGVIASSTNVTATGIYGVQSDLMSGSKGRKVQVALTKEVESKELGVGAWTGAIHAFEHWIEAQAEKQQERSQRKERQLQPAEQHRSTKPASTNEEDHIVAPQPSAESTAAHTSIDHASRAVGHAIPPTTTRDLHRSPLAPKSRNIQGQKKLPVPSRRFTLANKQQLPPNQEPTPSNPDTTNSVVIAAAAAGKENLPPPSSIAANKLQVQQSVTATPTKQIHLNDTAAATTTPNGMNMDMVVDLDLDGNKPAIPPEMQEHMMQFGSPFRRKGALRRSPI